MAQSNRVQSTTIAFNVQGIQEIFGYHKKIKDSMKEIIDLKKKSLAESGKVGAEYEAEAKHIKALETEMRRYSKTANDLQGILENTGKASAKQLQQAEKALKNLRDGIKFDGKKMGVADAEKMVGNFNKEIERVRKQLETIQADAHNATGFKVMGKSVQQLNDYITNFEKNAQFLTSQMQNGKQVFAEWGAKATEAKVRLGQLDGTLLSVNKNTNAETLQAYIKGWQDIAKYGGASAEQVAKANEHIARAEGLMRDMMQRRVDNAGKTRFDGKELYSPAQVREAVEYMKQLSTSEKMTAEEREKLNASIKRGDEYLKQLTLDQQRYSMQLQLGGKQMSNIKTLSDASLASQKKYWTEMVANTKQGTAEYSQYLSTLQAVTNEEQRRASQKTLGEGGRLVGQVNQGQFQGSIRETEEAIKKIQEYKKELKGPQQENMLLYAEQALTKLNEKLQQATTEAINGRKAFDSLKAAAANGVDDVAKRLPNSTEELKRMRENLEAYKKSLKNPDTSTLHKIETMFTAIDKKEREVLASEIDWNNYKGSKLKERSVAELKRAYEVLKKEIEGLSPAQEGYNKKAMQMKQINERLKTLNKDMSYHVSSLENAASRLKNYVMIYFGFNAAMAKTRQVIQNIIELSDQMTNVQKVTQLTNEEIERMTNDLQALDTRTANQQLMEMAEQAGKLGIATREGADGLVSFVKEGQKIVNTLGDIGGAEAINELLKVNDVVNKNSQGLEKDLNKIGSAILNIGNNSKATYADVVEFTKRLGATGSVTGLTMEQIMGLGGAFSSLGESMERSATATQRVLMGIVSHTEAVAKSVNVGYDELDQLIQNGKTLEAMELVLTELAEQGPAVYDAFFKAIGGRNNVQARNAMALLSQHLEELNYQVALAEEGFAEGTLVTQEFERANNNLAGVMAQVGNEFYEMTTSVEGSNGALLTMAKGLLEVVKWMREWNIIGGVLITTSLLLTKSIIANTKAWWANATAAAMNESTYNGFKGTFFGFIQILVQSVRYIGFQTAALLGSASAAEKARVAAERLKIAWSSNWITLALVALGMLIGKLIATAKATSDARKSLGELIKKGEDEIAMLNSLYKSLQNVNLAQQDRTNKINTFNRLFGSYLSNILREENVAKRLGIAYREAAAAIREKNAAALEEKADQAAEEASGDKQREALGLMMEGLGMQTLGPNWAQKKGLSDYDKSSLVSSIQAAVISAVGNGETSPERIRKEVIRRLGSDKRFISTSYGSGAQNNSRVEKNLLTGDVIITDNGKATVRPFASGQSKTRLQKALDDFINATLSGEEAKQPFMLQAGGQRALAQDEEIGLLKELRKQILIQQNTKRPIEQRELYKNIMQYRKLYKKYEKDSRVSQGESVYLRNFEDLLPGLYEVVHPWGQTSFDLSGQAGKDVAANAVDFFNDIYNNWKKGQKILRTSAYKPPVGITIPEDIDFWSKEQFRDWAYNNWQAAKKLQETDNFDNPQGNFKDFTDGGKKKKGTEIKDLMDATLKKLEEYYERRNMMAEKYLNEGQISEEEYNRYMFANEQEHLLERENLRKKWLDSSHEFATEGVKDLMKGIDFPKLNAFLKGMGQNMVDGIKLNIAKDENDVEKNIRANREKVLKVLLDERPIAKVAETFTKDLASLGVLWSQMDEAVLRTEMETQAMMIEKMSFLMDEAKKGYSLTAEQLIEDAQKNGSPFIQAWLSGLTPDALAALVLKTQGFYDEYEDAVRKMVKRMEKRIEFERNQVGADGLSQNQRWEESRSRISRRQQVEGVDESWGMAGNDLAGVESSERTRVDLLQKELEIKREMYEEDKKRYAMELEAIEKRIYAEGDPKERAALIQEAEAMKTASLLAEQEAWKGIQDAQREATEAQFELMSKSVDQIKPYYDNLNSFAESFGENIFGSKEDREQAGRELLSNVIKTTGRMLTQWLVYVSTKQMFDKMEILNEEVKQKQLLAIKLQAQAAELSALGQTAQAEEAVKAAQNATDAASAQAKEAAKAGWVGWAIGAGLSLLMTMIFSALSARTKSAISAATGVSGGAGKLATGMLTYAKGRYPVYADGVFADDGNGRAQGQMVSVRGDDGRDYRAMYKPQLRTGVVNGPHLGIVGEKGAELIVDHGTYEGLKRYDPETLRRIYAMKMYGQRSVDFGRAARTGNEVLLNRSGVRRYAAGNVEDALARDGVGDGAAEGMMAGMQETLAELTAVLAAVKAEGIQAHMEYLGSSGAKSTMDKGDRFLRRVGKG